MVSAVNYDYCSLGNEMQRAIVVSSEVAQMI